jgi:hypothetical protein
VLKGFCYLDSDRYKARIIIAGGQIDSVVLAENMDGKNKGNKVWLRSTGVP